MPRGKYDRGGVRVGGDVAKSPRDMCLEAYLDCLREADSVFVQLNTLQKRYADLQVRAVSFAQKLGVDQFVT